MNDDPLIYRIALGMVRDLGRDQALDILEAIHGDAQTFFSLTQSQLESLVQRRMSIFDDTCRASLLDKARQELTFVQANNITCTPYDHPRYPTMLTACADAPLMLYSVGQLQLEDRQCVAIVGTRHATAYGTRWVHDLVMDLASRLSNLVIISGLAYGIDIAAHRAALEAGVPTVAVLGTGLNTIYPAAHRQTAVDMVRNGGGLISQYTRQEPTHPGHFLARNRIVAGLCQCTVVAESGIRGGAMATARLAFGYNREVLALPGRVTDTYSQGCNMLIHRQTAQLCTGADDVIAACGWNSVSSSPRQRELFAEPTPEEARILDHLRQHPSDNINALAMALSMPVGQLTSQLTDMEFRDLVQSLPGGRYAPLL